MDRRLRSWVTGQVDKRDAINDVFYLWPTTIQGGKRIVRVPYMKSEEFSLGKNKVWSLFDAWRPQFYGLAVISKHYLVSVIKTFSPFHHGGFEKIKSACWWNLERCWRFRATLRVTLEIKPAILSNDFNQSVSKRRSILTTVCCASALNFLEASLKKLIVAVSHYFQTIRIQSIRASFLL